MTKQHQEINGVQWNQMAGAGVLPDIHGQDLLAIHDNFKFTSNNNKATLLESVVLVMYQQTIICPTKTSE